MVNVVIVYETKYGNTKTVAEAIAEGIKETEGIRTVINELKQVDTNNLMAYDAILIGSPNHFGGPTRGIKGFIDKLGKLQLKEKKFAVFDTYIGSDFEKAVKKMEKSISEKIPGIKQLTPGLSIKVQGVKGPIVQEEPLKCREFGKKIASQLKT